MALDHFISYLSLEKNYSGHTINAYKKDIATFAEFCGAHYGSEAIEEVPYSLIRSWIVSLSETGNSNRTINRKMASLRAYYRFLLKTETIALNPMAKHKALKTSKKVEVPFSEMEMEKVLNTISYGDDFEGARDRLIITLLYTTGMRRAELIGLKIGDIDLATKTIKVLGKRNKERILPLLPETLALYTTYLEHRKAVVGDHGEGHVFLSASGNKIYETLVYRIINRYFTEVSTKVKKSPHIVRHTFATHLLNKGADLNAVKELLGHTSLASTQVYTHSGIAELKRVHQKAHPRNTKT